MATADKRFWAMKNATLFDYMKQCQRFIHDGKQIAVEPHDLEEYANRARREVAMRSQCVRIKPPIAAPIKAGVVTAPGSGYSAHPTVAISAPDFPPGDGANPNGAQAIGSVTVVGGQIASFNIEYGGDGYFQPVITVTDTTGSGATISPILAFSNLTQMGQEVYPFSAIDLSDFPLVDSILAVKSVSIIYANYRYSLPQYSFTIYQAMIRQYPFQYQYVPTFCSQYGQGTAGSLYLYPLPSQQYQMEWDCFCLPSDLSLDNGNIEDVIPLPWSDAVAHFMAYLAYLELQAFNNAKLHLDLFDQFMHRYRAAASPGRAANVYGRW